VILMIALFLLGALCAVASGEVQQEGNDASLDEATAEASALFPQHFSPFVKLDQGMLYGDAHKNDQGEAIHCFRGIPYAYPPVGDLRFQDPVANPSWDGLWDGTIDPPACAQMFNGEVIGSEDCLLLNVYRPIPKDGESGNYSVIFFIHGGEFLNGAAVGYPALPLLNHDVVLVVPQYRLGGLGFLSCENEALSGNYGLKDLEVALNWVQDNIAKFGGDPSSVTIMGHDAGAYAAHYLALRHQNEGKFSRLILQSGSALCPKYRMEKGDHLAVFRHVAYDVGCLSQEELVEEAPLPDSIHECMKKAPLESLVTAHTYFQAWYKFPFVMVPRIDGDFIKEEPETLFKNSTDQQYEVLVGWTREEEAEAALALYQNQLLVQELEEEFDIAGPISLFMATEEEPLAPASLVYETYNDGNVIRMDKADSVVQMFSQRVAKCNCNLAFLRQDSGAVFVYELRHRGARSTVDSFNMAMNEEWVAHGDDLQYLFHGKASTNPWSSNDDAHMSYLLTSLWSNFAKHGDPTPNNELGFSWPSLSRPEYNYVALKTKPSIISAEPRFVVIDFWRSLPLRENQLLFGEEGTSALTGMDLELLGDAVEEVLEQLSEELTDSDIEAAVDGMEGSEAELLDMIEDDEGSLAETNEDTEPIEEIDFGLDEAQLEEIIDQEANSEEGLDSESAEDIEMMMALDEDVDSEEPEESSIDVNVAEIADEESSDDFEDSNESTDEPSSDNLEDSEKSELYEDALEKNSGGRGIEKSGELEDAEATATQDELPLFVIEGDDLGVEISASSEDFYQPEFVSEEAVESAQSALDSEKVGMDEHLPDVNVPIDLNVDLDLSLGDIVIDASEALTD